MIEVLTATAAEAQQRRIAGGLVAAGLRPGDRVAVAVPTSAAMLSLVLGSLRRGIIPVVLHAGLLEHERAGLLADAAPDLIVDGPALAELDDGPPVELAPFPLGRPMHYTSGTTGTPKGVWSGVLDERQAERLAIEERELWGFHDGDINLACSPLHHSAPIRFAAGTLLAGGTTVLLDRFDARATIAAIAAHRPTTAFMAPAHLQRVFAATTADDPPLSSFRLLAHAGAPCPEPLKRQALASFPAGSVWEFYGSTEGQFTACSPAEWSARPGTVGRARPGRAIDVDEHGVVWCTAPDHARFEYWRDPERTAAAWRGTAFTVGDIGRLDTEGYLFLDGRRDDLIISGGVNVYPLEVERVLHDVPGVDDIAVFGVTDDQWGLRVCAVVVGRATPSEVLAAARQRLAGYKRPKDVYIVAEIPRTATGKVRRSTLAADLGLE